jgi:hypothetical protein
MRIVGSSGLLAFFHPLPHFARLNLFMLLPAFVHGFFDQLFLLYFFLLRFLLLPAHPRRVWRARIHVFGIGLLGQSPGNHQEKHHDERIHRFPQGYNSTHEAVNEKRTDLFIPQLLGSRSMPQTGHLPGLSLTTSGCIGQVYTVAALVVSATAAVESAALREDEFWFPLHDKKTASKKTTVILRIFFMYFSSESIVPLIG